MCFLNKNVHSIRQMMVRNYEIIAQKNLLWRFKIFLFQRSSSKIIDILQRGNIVKLDTSNSKINNNLKNSTKTANEQKQKVQILQRINQKVQQQRVGGYPRGMLTLVKDHYHLKLKNDIIRELQIITMWLWINCISNS